MTLLRTLNEDTFTDEKPDSIINHYIKYRTA